MHNPLSPNTSEKEPYTMKRTLQTVLAGTALLLIAPHLMAETAAAQAQQAPAPKVDVYEVRPPAQLPVAFEYPARLQSMQSATVVARVTGVLLKQHYAEGSFVKKGTLLYTIEPDIYAAAVHEREADCAVAEALFTNAKRDWERVEALYKDKAISKREYDASLAAYERTKAELNAAGARLESAKIDLGYTEVTAPISGIAGKKETDVGNVVTSGTPLVTITRTDPVYAEFSIPDKDMLKINAALQSGRWSKSVGSSFTAELNIGALKRTGSVDYVAPVVDAKTAGIAARATIANGDNALMPGSFGRITLSGIQRNSALIVPQKAVLQSPKGTIVFIVEGGKAAVRPVTLGDTDGENYIVEGPLRPGDQVIVNNFFRVKPGMAVAVDKTINAAKE